MIKILNTPDCPVCGAEMIPQRDDMENGAVAYFWHCQKCGANTPKSINKKTALRNAMDWSESNII